MDGQSWFGITVEDGRSGESRVRMISVRGCVEVRLNVKGFSIYSIIALGPLKAGFIMVPLGGM